MDSYKVYEAKKYGKEIYYHISPVGNIEKFEIRQHEGLGTSFYGAGVYLTKDEGVIEYYKEKVKDAFENLYMYTCEVDMSNVYDEDEKLEDYYNYMEKFDDEIKVSKMMVKEKVFGITYYSEEDGNSIVVYNPEIIKIIKKEEI